MSRQRERNDPDAAASIDDQRGAEGHRVRPQCGEIIRSVVQEDRPVDPAVEPFVDQVGGE